MISLRLSDNNIVQLFASYDRFIYFLLAIAWLVLVNSLMIADVWDETNALVILSSELISSAGLLEAAKIFWLQELPLDIYRPLGSSFFIILAKLSAGNFIFLRFVNAAFILAAAVLFAQVLDQKGDKKARALTFYTIFLFSSSALITTSWFANIFDASCLFFIALATKAYSGKNYALCGISMVLAIFCKEAYVLSIPFLMLAVYQAKDTNIKAIVAVSITLIVFSAIYWLARQSVAPLGSDADIHGFSADTVVSSSLSLFAGFWFQFSKFTPSSPILWIGVGAVILSIVGLKSTASRTAIVAMYLMAAVIYWGMFSYQGENVITAHNFVARLYLIPFVLALYLICREANRPTILIVAALSIWGFGETYNDHKIFQTTYLELYEIAQQTEGQTLVHYPEKTLVDTNRNLLIGDFPDASLVINPLTGAIERR
ncbi:MAG: hypothetical protein ACI9IQ_003060 [Cyclobacteriaceae bacterium]|jgi:hypothetical protein